MSSPRCSFGQPMRAEHAAHCAMQGSRSLRIFLSPVPGQIVAESPGTGTGSGNTEHT